MKHLPVLGNVFAVTALSMAAERIKFGVPFHV